MQANIPYRPMVSLVFAVEYFFFGLNPAVFHFVNFLFHAANIILVYLLAFLIINERLPAGLTAAIFAIHPMSSGTVVWISSANVTVFTFFLLLSCLSYTSYLINNKHPGYFIFSCITFLCALLSDAAALILPFLLMIIDFKFKTGFRLNDLVHKVPFLIIAVIWALFVTFYGVKSHNGQAVLFHYSIFDRIFMASWSLFFCLFKFIFLFKLSVVHPSPVKTGFWLSWYYYVSFVVVLLLIYVVYILMKNEVRNKKTGREIFFGLSWFMIPTIYYILVSNDNEIFAELNTYLPYLGLSFCVSAIAGKICHEARSLIFQKRTAIFLLSVLLFFIFLTFKRSGLWKDSITLFRDAADKYPEHPYPIYLLGKAEIFEKNYFDAYYHLSLAVSQHENFTEAWYMRGISQFKMKNFVSAITDFDKVTKLKADHFNAWYYMGCCYENLGSHGEALNCYSQVIRLNPFFKNIFEQRGKLYNELGSFRLAISDLDHAIMVNPASYQSYNDRGLSYLYLKQYDLAGRNFNKALEINPFYPDAYRNRGILRFLMEDHSSASVDFDRAVKLNPADEKAIFYRGLVYLQTGQKESACADFKSAAEKGYDEALIMTREYCK